MLTKTRHNKKRNTAFIYESLVRELTKSIVSKDPDKKKLIISIMKEYFGKGSILRKQLELYKALYETNGMDQGMCEKLINEVKKAHALLDQQEVFDAQTALINKINKSLSKKIFSNFVPNYKSLATISQILNPDASVKHRVLLESKLVESLSSKHIASKPTMKPIDSLIYRTFVKNFNNQYKDSLLEEQKELLSRYIASIHDDGIELKIFLNEEIARLRACLKNNIISEDLSNSALINEKVNKLLNIMENYKTSPIDVKMVEQVLKIQNLVKEMSTNGLES